MNEDILKGKWHQIKGEIQKEWGKLTDNDLDKVEGEMTRLKGLIEEKYGHASEEVDKKITDFIRRLQEQQKW